MVNPPSNLQLIGLGSVITTRPLLLALASYLLLVIKMEKKKKRTDYMNSLQL